MINLNSINFCYDDKSQLMQFDFRIERGEKVAVIGASGSGKTTLLNLIAGFVKPKKGKIYLNGEDHTKTIPHRRPVSILFQNHNLFNHLNVRQNIAIGVAPNLKLNNIQEQRVLLIAEKVGLSQYISRLPDELSGGQQQRVALARCLLRDKPILLLDEPFSALDKTLRIEMLALLKALCEEKGLTLLIVTHQPDEVEHFVDRQLALNF